MFNMCTFEHLFWGIFLSRCLSSKIWISFTLSLSKPMKCHWVWSTCDACWLMKLARWAWSLVSLARKSCWSDWKAMQCGGDQLLHVSHWNVVNACGKKRQIFLRCFRFPCHWPWPVRVTSDWGERNKQQIPNEVDSKCESSKSDKRHGRANQANSSWIAATSTWHVAAETKSNKHLFCHICGAILCPAV